MTSIGSHRPYVSIALDGDHTARGVGIGDLDADGVLDIVIKQPAFNTDPYHREGYWKRSREPYKLEAYNGANGRLMWRYDMGWAIETGRWEEIITGLPGELRLYSSTHPSSWRRSWLMEDRQYRLGVAAGSMGYYREPQLSTSLAPGHDQ